MTGTTLGVEEEFLLVDTATGRPAPRVWSVLRDAEAIHTGVAQPELHRAQIETATPTCSSLDEVATSLSERRRQLAEAAAAHRARVVASATYPAATVGEGELITEGERYASAAVTNGLLAEQLLICGCHIHVSIDSPDAAVATIARMRRWLPVLLALSANSPYWDGRDTGFASFRTTMWSPWPTAGPPGRFPDAAAYWGMVDSLVEAGVILDRGMAYWDARPSDKYPTVEVRVADVPLTVDDGVTLAALARALVVHFAGAGDEPDDFRVEMLKAATWNAARHGLGDRLIDPLDATAAPAAQMVWRLVEVLGPTLTRLGDAARVESMVGSLLERGTGADRQRAAFATRRRIEDVVTLAAV